MGSWCQRSKSAFSVMVLHRPWYPLLSHSSPKLLVTFSEAIVDHTFCCYFLKRNKFTMQLEVASSDASSPSDWNEFTLRYYAYTHYWNGSFGTQPTMDCEQDRNWDEVWAPGWGSTRLEAERNDGTKIGIGTEIRSATRTGIGSGIETSESAIVIAALSEARTPSDRS